eukprot:TRINITY_DN1540_c0_g2_i8.p1 TRINITY_DN1540_c0_g2~~TRINITY_DN1540_c0_g2_i8.p1  ORF type:complete len:125 (+),score=20.16 TRINITY_DN1540_c0_g2_i8:74-448(+)
MISDHGIIDSIYEDNKIPMDVVLELKIERLQRWNSSTETFVILLSDHGSERRINWIPTHNLIQFFIKFPQLLPSKIFHCDECGADCLCVCRCIERPHEVKINSKCTHLPLVGKFYKFIKFSRIC